MLSHCTLLESLHWLSVVYRIKVELATFTYRTISIQQPIHLINQLNIFDNYIGPLGHVYKQRFVTKTKLNIGKQAFSVAAPAIWT